jgi:hypothetical protein
MLAAEAAARAGFAFGLLTAPEILYGRTRWPHWCQALACVMPHGWPPDFDQDRFRELIFQLGDYAAWLDDVCDYVPDCRATVWNTISDSTFRRRALPDGVAEAIQARLLVALADQDVQDVVLARGLDLRRKIDQSIGQLRLDPDRLYPLIAALTHAYLG